MVPYDNEAKRYIRVLYAEEAKKEDEVSATAFAEAGTCSTNNDTLCPGPIDLQKLTLYGNDDTPVSLRSNLQILRCLGTRCEKSVTK